jgi:hypothetical protein
VKTGEVPREARRVGASDSTIILRRQQISVLALAGEQNGLIVSLDLSGLALGLK